MKKIIFILLLCVNIVVNAQVKFTPMTEISSGSPSTFTVSQSGQSFTLSASGGGSISQTVTPTTTTASPSEAAVYEYVTSRSSTITLLPADIATTSTVGVTVFTMTVEANKTYIIRGKVGIGCDNTGGVRFASTIPSGSGQGLIIGRTSSNTALAASGFVSAGAWSQPLNTVNSSAGSGIMEQMITVGVTGGTYSLLISPATNGQTATIYTATTYFEIIKL